MSAKKAFIALVVVLFTVGTVSGQDETAAIPVGILPFQNTILPRKHLQPGSASTASIPVTTIWKRRSLIC